MRGSGMFSVGDGLGAIFEKLADNVVDVVSVTTTFYVGASESSAVIPARRGRPLARDGVI